MLKNDVWGKYYVSLVSGQRDSITDYQQCIFVSQDKSSYGWNWRWPNGIIPIERWDKVKSYPHILFGKNPWGDVSPQNKLPEQIRNIISLQASYKAAINITSQEKKYNLSFDGWITNSPPHDKSNIQYELMIWEHSLNMPPAGTIVATPQIDGIPYNLYEGQGSNEGITWTIFTYLPQASIQISDRIIDIKPFLSNLVSSGRILPTHFLTNMSF